MRLFLDREDLDFIQLSAARCSLDRSPKKNWVEEEGGLPNYICEVARAIMRSGKSRDRAIAAAVNRVKRWAVDPKVTPKTRAKAAAAVAQWEKMKAKRKAKRAVKLTAFDDIPVLQLSGVSYPVDIVRSAFEQRQRSVREAWRKENPDASYDDGPRMFWIKEQWSDFIIVCVEYSAEGEVYKIPYAVSDSMEVIFGSPEEVKVSYVPVDEDMDEGLSDSELESMMMTASIMHERSLSLAYNEGMLSNADTLRMLWNSRHSDEAPSFDGEVEIPGPDGVPVVLPYRTEPSIKVVFGKLRKKETVPYSRAVSYEQPTGASVASAVVDALSMSRSALGKTLQLTSLNIPMEDRDKWAKDGEALPDGSYPIPSKSWEGHSPEDFLKRAIQSFGRANEEDRDKVKSHIKKRAKALGLEELIPEDWK